MAPNGLGGSAGDDPSPSCCENRLRSIKQPVPSPRPIPRCAPALRLRFAVVAPGAPGCGSRGGGTPFGPFGARKLRAFRRGEVSGVCCVAGFSPLGDDRGESPFSVLGGSDSHSARPAHRRRRPAHSVCSRRARFPRASGFAGLAAAVAPTRTIRASCYRGSMGARRRIAGRTTTRGAAASRRVTAADSPNRAIPRALIRAVRRCARAGGIEGPSAGVVFGLGVRHDCYSASDRFRWPRRVGSGQPELCSNGEGGTST